MIKKIVYYGLAMIVLAIVIFLLSGYLLHSSVGNNVSIVNLTIKPYNFSYTNVNYTNSSAVVVEAIIDHPANLYVLNNTTFTKWNSYIYGKTHFTVCEGVANNTSQGMPISGCHTINEDPNGLKYVESLGVNSSYIFRNKTLIFAPVAGTGTAGQPLANRLYIVVDNTNGSVSSNATINATISYLPFQSSKLIGYELVDLVAFVIVIAGILIIVYGFIKKDKPKELENSNAKMSDKELKDKESVEKLYKGIKTNKKKAKSNNQDKGGQ